MLCHCGCGHETSGPDRRFRAGHWVRVFRTPRPIAERFWEKVDKSGGPGACWPWMACRHAAGYGRFNRDRERVYAHRLAYELTCGPIPEGMQVCHHCDNPPCCNPAHFFLGTMADNQEDKTRKGRTVNPLTDELKRRTHCPQGHPYDAKNTLWRPIARGKKARACRACMSARGKRWYRRKKAEREAAH